MSTDIVIDVNSAEMSNGNYPFLMMTKGCTNHPVFMEMMKALEGNGDIAPLKSQMKAAVENYAQAKGKERLKNEGKEELGEGVSNIEKVSNINVQSGYFDLEQIIAVALKADQDKGNVKEAVQNALQVFNSRISEQTKKDLNRPGLVLDIEGKRLLVDNEQALETLLPELTGEQRGYIAQIGANQFLAIDCGYPDMMKAFTDQGVVVKASNKGNDAPFYVSLNNGKVQIVTSREFEILDDEGVPHVFRSSEVLDITALRGEEFKVGRATAEVPTRVVYSGLEENYRRQLQTGLAASFNPEALKAGTVELSKIVTQAAERGLEKESDALKENNQEIERRQNISETLSGNQKGDRSKSDIDADFLQKLGHSKEFMATRMAAEYAANTPLWQSWKGYDQGTNNLPNKDPAKPQNKFASAMEIYSVLETDKQKQYDFAHHSIGTIMDRSAYAAAKVAQYLDGSSIDKTTAGYEKEGAIIKEIISPVVQDVESIRTRSLMEKANDLNINDKEGRKCALESLAYSSIDSNKDNQLKFASSKILEYTSASKTPSKEVVASIVSPILPAGTKILDRDADLILRATQEHKNLSYKDRLMKIVDKTRIAVGLVSKDIAQVATQAKTERKEKRKSFVEELNAKLARGSAPHIEGPK